MVLGKLDSHVQKNETRPFSYTSKDKLKMDERPKCQIGNVKILEKNIGNNLFEIGYSNFLEDTLIKAREKIAKVNYWDLIKIKIFCTAKKQSRKLKNLQNGRRYLQMTYQINGYYPRSIKNLLNSTSKKQIIQS